MTRRFGEWPKKIPEKIQNTTEWVELESRVGWKGNQVTISMRPQQESNTGVEYCVYVDEKMSYIAVEESDAWLYFASLTIT
jgi:hypothetical protein